jgi:hypothetical protein
MTETSLAVSLITTCKGRLAHLKETLPAFLAQGAGCEVIVVDYDCPEGAATWVNANHPRDRSPFDGSPFFDTDRLFQRSDKGVRPVMRFKGVRARLLSMLQARDPAQYLRLTAERGYECATLWKIPLIRTGSGVTLETVHSVNIQPPIDVELALAHFKFGPDLDGRIADALLSRNCYRGSIEYDFLKAAVDVLSTELLVFGGSARYAGPTSLESAGLCFVARES